MEPAVIKVRKEEKTAVVEVSGRLDVTGGRQSSRELLSTVQVLVLDRLNIVLDLTRIARMDSDALGRIADCYRVVSRDRLRFALVVPEASRDRRMLRTTKFDQIVQVFDTLPEALASFTEPNGDAA